MTRIAFLIADIASDRIKKLLCGMIAAAEELDAQIVVCPGKGIVSAGHQDTGLPDCYQEEAVFRYIDKKNTDVILVDLKELGKHASAMKKEAFLGQFQGIPLLTLTETEGFAHVSSPPDTSYEARGFRAVEDAAAYAKTGELAKEYRVADIHTGGMAQSAALEALERAMWKLSHGQLIGEDNNPYDIVLEQALILGVKQAGLFLFTEAAVNTVKTPFVLPEEIMLFSRIRRGKLTKMKEAKALRSRDAVKTVAGKSAEEGADDARVFIAGSIYLDNRQIGLLVTDLAPVFLSPQIHALFMTAVCGAVRLIADETQIIRTQEALSEHQRALDKETSVLDRLGDEDYLTKRLNRRGFFAKAYDFLQKNFREGTHAIVAYIDMDSIKSINQFFGREEGDYAVRRVADILTEVFGKDAVLGRIRGNEFAVLVVTDDPGRADAYKDEMAAQNMRLMQDASKPYTIHLQFSICDFAYSKGLSLKQMLAESDDNLQKVRQL